jgi:N-methylhydantoinase A
VGRLRVAVDTGGTFTDFVVLHEDTGALDVFKVPSTRGHEADGIIDGLRAYLERTNAQASDVVFFAHGTTVGTNGLLEGAGARTGLIVTEGFRGVYELDVRSLLREVAAARAGTADRRSSRARALRWERERHV